nr:MAG TPA: hypothetical protein [Caudoviricetes sp.]
MRRGTTPTIIVGNLPVSLDQIDKLYLIFRPENNGSILLEKTLDDAVISNNTLYFTLTQAETLALPLGIVRRSIVLKTKAGARLESYPDRFKVEETAKSGVI